MRKLVPTAAALLAAACASSNTKSSTGETPAAEPDNGEEIRELMNKQFAAVDSIHRAIAFGEFAEAQKSAGWLAQNAMVGEVPAGWAATVEAVRVRSTKIASGKKLEDISSSLASVLEACGTCHLELGLTLKPGDTGADQPVEGADPKMLQHTFAMSHLQQGLLLPSEVLWEQGAQMIAAGSLLDAATDDETRILAASLQELASDAALVEGLKAKSMIYGELMGKCTACHAKSR